VINSLGGEQDNVVFMGRRSFRMEIAAGPHSSELAIPMRASAVPTEKIFEADRDRGGWAAAAAALQPARLKSNGTSVVALCVTTFVLGIALTLTLTGRAAPRRAPDTAAAQPAQVAAPATAPTPTPVQPIVVQTMPIAAPTDAEILAGFAFQPARRPLAKPARAARPRPVRAARPAPSADADDASVADPFADPTPPAKPTAKAWVDPFAE
jgi:hypothetical protein